MNYFDKNKILTVSVVLLLIVNIGILVLLWTDRTPKQFPEGRPPGMRMQPPDGIPPQDMRQPGRGPKEFLIHELNMSDRQIQDYERLVDEHQADMKRLRDKIRDEKDELWNTLTNSASDSVAVEKLTSEIGADQKETELVTYRHFQKVKELCSDEQKKKFDRVINDALKMMGPNGPPPAPH